MRRSNPGLDPVAALDDWSKATSITTDPWSHYTCKLVTPLYGGGVRAAEIDPQMPIRASGIRGQLRFWWRIACCAPSEPSESMFQREVAIWGGIASAGPTSSQVAVRVDRITGLEIKPAFVYQPNHKKPGELRTMPEAADWVEPYALFPARGELTKDKRDVAVAPHRLAMAGLGFRLGFKYGYKLSPAQREEVETALRWWASFGGVGARTRRGLGAIRVEGLDPVTAEDVCAMGGQLALRSTEKTSDSAWKNAVTQLKEFRQKLDVARNFPSVNSKSPAGRSLWPEADTIRELSGCALEKHAQRLVSGSVFPRAAFGLPVVFHFKDAPSQQDRQKKGFDSTEFDPDDHTLEPADPAPNNKRDRMASPLILRPYWDGSQWRPAALLVPDWKTALGVDLKFKNQSYIPDAWPTDPAERRHLAAQIPPMAGRGDDPLTAFMTYFMED